MAQQQVNIKINGMTCNHCTNFIKNTISDLAGIENVEVNLESAIAAVQYNDQKLKPQAIIDEINNTHFSVVGIV